MKILFIGGCLPQKMDTVLLERSKSGIDYSADIFQKKIIRGLEECKLDYHVFSAPLIGAYPNEYRDAWFHATGINDEKTTYVSFCNLWGYRNISRARALKKTIETYVKQDGGIAYSVIVYCAHEPYLEAAAYIKKLLPGSRICFIVPDLPQFMNLNEKRSPLYDVLKKYDIKKMKSYISTVDKFVILTEQMHKELEIGDRPYSVVEGLLESIPSMPDSSVFERNADDVVRIVYTGRLNISFGIVDLVKQFSSTKNENYRLILCGDGDARDYVLKKTKEDKRVEYLGQVPVAKAREVINSAHILVNPRPNIGEYTKFSFPSKTLEYLLSGKPVVMYRLDGMPDAYQNFIYEIQNNDIMKAVEDALNCTTHNARCRRFFEYAQDNLVVTRIIDKFFL